VHLAKINGEKTDILVQLKRFFYSLIQTGLQPCQLYHFRLRSQEMNEIGDILWSFPTAKTLPKFDVDIVGKHKALTIKVSTFTITQ